MHEHVQVSSDFIALPWLWLLWLSLLSAKLAKTSRDFQWEVSLLSYKTSFSQNNIWIY